MTYPSILDTHLHLIDRSVLAYPSARRRSSALQTTTSSFGSNVYQRGGVPVAAASDRRCTWKSTSPKIRSQPGATGNDLLSPGERESPDDLAAIHQADLRDRGLRRRLTARRPGRNQSLVTVFSLSMPSIFSAADS